jgi:diguanylate cyclase (GGDEF)-like protein
MSARYTILIVDDNEDNRYSLRKTLHNDDYQFHEAHDDTTALVSFSREQPDLVLLDVRLPGVDGFQICEQIRQLSPHVPVMFVTANVKDFSNQVLGFEKGADDYIIQPYEPREMALKVKALLRNKRLYDELLEEITRLESLKGKLAASNDELKELNVTLDEKNRYLNSVSMTDPLTSLYNRKYFHQRLQKELSSVRRYKHETTVALLDLDRFGRLNERYGQSQGDVLLKECAGLLVSSLRRSDVVIRFEGARFVVVLTHTTEVNAMTKARVIQDRLANYRFSLYEDAPEADGFRVTASVAVLSLAHEWVTDEAAVVQSLELALVESKRQGFNQLVTGKRL